MADLRAQIERAKVEQEQLRMQANTQQEVAIVKAEEVGSVLITQVEGEKSIAESKIKAQVIDIINKAKANANSQIKSTEQRAQVMGIEADAKL